MEARVSFRQCGQGRPLGRGGGCEPELCRMGRDKEQSKRTASEEGEGLV